jgi:hypothetical protein
VTGSNRTDHCVIGSNHTSLAARSNHQHVEQLRMSLEGELGPELFLAAYKCCRAQGVGAVAMATCDHDDDCQDSSAEDRLLGLLQGRWHLVCQLHRLLTWEDTAYS